MTTLTELNGKVWYRFLKVLYILLYLPYFLLLFFVMYNFGRDYNEPILPDSVQEIFKDPEFYKLDDYDMRKVLLTIESRTKIIDPFKSKTKKSNPLDNFDSAYLDNIISELKNKPIPTTPLNKAYIYKPYHAWNITNSIIWGLIVTFSYILIMECIRRGFYYVLIGKIFPKE